MNVGNGAGRETRTLTLLPEPDFESGASTSSATPAGDEMLRVGDYSRKRLPAPVSC